MSIHHSLMSIFFIYDNIAIFMSFPICLLIILHPAISTYPPHPPPLSLTFRYRSLSVIAHSRYRSLPVFAHLLTTCRLPSNVGSLHFNCMNTSAMKVSFSVSISPIFTNTTRTNTSTW